MCVVCGCSDPKTAVTISTASAQSNQSAQSVQASPEQPAIDPKHGDLHFGAGAAKVSVPGLSQARAIQIETDILGANQRLADQNRAHFAAHHVTALNLVSSPGSGKTTLLCATIEALKQRAPHLPVAVIEGDQQTSFDADRIRATGAPAVQVNTGKGCHLDAPMVAQAFAQLHHHSHMHDHDHHHDDAAHDHAHHHDHDHDHDQASLLFIENVGNLVCPAMWDLGEAAKIAILSVTEGEDKPLKYPDMFAASRLMVLNKIDLLPHVRFDVARCIALAQRVNPDIEILQVSATTGEGMDAWLDWLMARVSPTTSPTTATEQALRQRIAALEQELAALKGKV